MVRNIHIVSSGSGSESEISSSATPQPDGVKLFSHLPDKTEEALSTFELLSENHYIDKLRNVYSASGEVMTCDCAERRVAGVNVACGVDSDCINRLTNVECVDDQCVSCGSQCQNQRFQRNQMADVSVFLTEHKGYGMRANCDIPAHTFIVEYKGEVIDDREYKLRKESYADEGIGHFYFMMIQENEIIDATKRASLGRFCNHSCDPVAYVEKWVVNKRYRMGIFAKRKIMKGEEITFDYNVDRYGSEPQKCYCGAKNCVGFLGGKTQTEILRLLPYAAREALGIRSSDEKRWIRLEKKMGIKISKDNVEAKVGDFVESFELQPLTISDIPKVSSCLLLPDNDVLIIDRILERFDTEDTGYGELLHMFNRLHGLQALTSSINTILFTVSDGKELRQREKNALVKIVNIFDAWPKLASKNTINSCNLETLLQELAVKMADKHIANLIDRILLNWRDLPVIYRIPKRIDGGEDGKPMDKFSTHIDDRRSRLAQSAMRLVDPAASGAGSSAGSAMASRTDSAGESVSLSPAISAVSKGQPNDVDVASLPESRKIEGKALPPGWEWTTDPTSGSVYFYNREKGLTQWQRPEWPPTNLKAGLESILKAVPNSTVDDGKKKRERERDRERDREREQKKRLRELEKKRLAEQDAVVKIEEQRMEKLTKIIEQASKEASLKQARGQRHHSHDSEGGRDRSSRHTHKHQHTTLHANHSHRRDSYETNDTEISSGKHGKVEKQWMLLFASAVPNMLKKYESHVGRGNMKNCAREITHVLAQKDMKRHTGQPVPSKLSDERKKKIDSFVSEYMHKFVSKFDTKKAEKRHSSSEELPSKKLKD
ncbi:hypothetical protein FOA43_000082 [Brettanomyces nanus]|uniref:Histone-lysine N-methyltransferase, H3 lysine-36 specific n=1 Tax=Eeniella nana TaxID=13502 RepID=A0A875RMV9_EENNA|nr:uncharacterized protein FOA43_000082 [Brettanomyces nanus]QPG72780.1 hypothetical protein FOA43_000082 [Brettanomyces nanus]